MTSVPTVAVRALSIVTRLKPPVAVVTPVTLVPLGIPVPVMSMPALIVPTGVSIAITVDEDVTRVATVSPVPPTVIAWPAVSAAGVLIVSVLELRAVTVVPAGMPFPVTASPTAALALPTVNTVYVVRSPVGEMLVDPIVEAVPALKALPALASTTENVSPLSGSESLVLTLPLGFER